MRPLFTILALSLMMGAIAHAQSPTFFWSNGQPAGTIVGAPDGPKFYFGPDGSTAMFSQSGTQTFLWSPHGNGLALGPLAPILPLPLLLPDEPLIEPLLEPRSSRPCAEVYRLARLC